MSEAKSIKAEAEISHREAARGIELESNKDKPIWEIDLHGLHLAEANQAVDHRSFLNPADFPEFNSTLCIGYSPLIKIMC